jgi:hypothetical protein
MTEPNPLRRACGRAAPFVALALACGCGPQSEYRLAMNAPWPDEYTQPARPRDPPAALLSQPIVLWHTRVEPEALKREALARAAGRPRVYAAARRALARRASGGGPPTIWYVEVRLGRTYFRRGPLPKMEQRPASSFGALVEAVARAVGAEVKPGPGVSFSTSIERQPDHLDPREALVRTLAEHGLFAREWLYLPLTLRSYEYPDRAAFLDAVSRVADALAEDADGRTMTIVPAAEWHAAAARGQEEFMARLAERMKGRRRFGDVTTTVALPTPTLLAKDPKAALRQAAFAVGAQWTPLPGEKESAP